MTQITTAPAPAGVWRARPEEDVFTNWNQALAAVERRERQRRETPVKVKDLRFTNDHNEICLTGLSTPPLALGHWGFYQLCRLVNAPNEFMQRQPLELAISNLNWAFEVYAGEEEERRLFWSDPLYKTWPGLAQAFNKPGHSFMRDSDLVRWGRSSQDYGWDTVRVSVSDRSLFAFVVYSDLTIGGKDEVQPGYYFRNSTVGQVPLSGGPFIYYPKRKACLFSTLADSLLEFEPGDYARHWDLSQKLEAYLQKFGMAKNRICKLTDGIVPEARKVLREMRVPAAEIESVINACSFISPIELAAACDARHANRFTDERTAQAQAVRGLLS